jgi:hypothetical protein
MNPPEETPDAETAAGSMHNAGNGGSAATALVAVITARAAASRAPLITRIFIITRSRGEEEGKPAREGRRLKECGRRGVTIAPGGGWRNGDRPGGLADDPGQTRRSRTC